MSKIINLDKFKEKRWLNEQKAKGRTPLYTSHLSGKIKGSPHFQHPNSEDFGERIQRIKTSLEKINFLMKELKKDR